MRKVIGLPLVAAALPLILGCAKPAPVPRPTGYPRIEVYPARYATAQFDSEKFKVNSSARFDSLSPRWFNLVYPAYGATVNCSLTQADSPAEVIANRRERFMRNLGGHTPKILPLPNGELIFSPTALKTPVQLLCVLPDRRILSAVAVTSGYENPDSVLPQIRALAEDLKVLAKSFTSY